MELANVVSLKKFLEFDDAQKEELYETLLSLSDGVGEIPKKSLRKILEITIAVLRYKGEQVQQAQRNDAQRDVQIERLLTENDKLKQMVQRLDDEKLSQKNKLKDLTEEIFQLQKRLQDAASLAEVSDKDSSDPLSELDKQEELLRNINTKNKHIKRLLKEIEALQNQNIEQSRLIMQAEKDLKCAKSEVKQLEIAVNSLDGERHTLKRHIDELRTELVRLETQNTCLQQQRDSIEADRRAHYEKLESKLSALCQQLKEKDKELERLRTSMEKLHLSEDEKISAVQDKSTDSSGDPSAEREVTKLMHIIELRDKHIEQLELKVKSMAMEMLESTALMNKITAGMEEERDPSRPRPCCQLVKESLQSANERCRELSEMLERSEEDNLLKSKQAMQAITALDAYQRGEDGLVKALRKCATLEQKLLSRDKQIRALVMELNSMHEIAHENAILRKRLNIPDDVVISAKNLAAKERNKDKIIDRLTLKLRASEEMRLQLKLEKSQLKQQILKMQQNLMQEEDEVSVPLVTATTTQHEPSEAGEVEESLRVQLSVSETSPAIAELQTKYHDVLEENETLRLGMQDILNKLREYDASSDHITTDADILCRLLKALETNSVVNSPKRLHSEIQDLKEREEALRRILAYQVPQGESSGGEEITSIQDVREEGDLSNRDDSSLHMPQLIDTSTRPTTPTKNIHPIAIPIIGDIADGSAARDIKDHLNELQLYKKYYEELQLHMAASESELSRYYSELLDQKRSLEVQLMQTNSSYSYMREEFDALLTTNKQQEMQHIQALAELKQTMLDERNEAIQIAYRSLPHDEDESHILRQRNMQLQSQLAFVTEKLLSGELMEQVKITDICADYGIILDNFQLDFVTAEEYEKQINDSRIAIDQRDESMGKVKHLEGLLEIAQEQIQSQQKLLNEITDNHINLRHLVADLQSTTDQKLLLTKMQRDLNSAQSELMSLKSERDELKQRLSTLQNELTVKSNATDQIVKDFQYERRNRDIKIKFLQRSLYALKEKYAKFTPLVFLTNFVFAYTRFVKLSTEHSERQDTLDEQLIQVIVAKLKDSSTTDESSNLIRLIRSETQYKLLEEKFITLTERHKTLEQDFHEQRMRAASESEHWQTIEALFSPQTGTCPDVATGTQTTNDQKSSAAEAEPPIPAERPSRLPSAPRKLIDRQVSPILTPSMEGSMGKAARQAIGTQTSMEEQSTSKSERQTNEVLVQTCHNQMEHQAVQTVAPQTQHGTNIEQQDELNEIRQQAKETERLLHECQEQLLSANRHVKEMEQQLDKAKKESQASTAPAESSGIIEKTILSLHTLLTEKDKSISKYQDMLQDERQQCQAISTRLNGEIDGLKSKMANLNFSIKVKDIEILELKTKLETISVRRNPQEKIDLATHTLCPDEGADNSLHELTDEKLEEMFQQDTLDEHGQAIAPTQPPTNNANQQPTKTHTRHRQRTHANVVEDDDGGDGAAAPAEDGDHGDSETTTNKIQELQLLRLQMKKLKDKSTYWENTLKVKEEEIALLKEKLQLYQEREKSIEPGSNPEMDELRKILDEKDKHINDLMDTLKNFHEDQQRYIKDSSEFSTDQMNKLAANLTRTEATNKMYQTQLEALRRQLANLGQREKSARELNQALRNQLIKRPVVSIKTELNARVKTENLQKRIQQLELDLDDARAEIHRQQVLIDAKRARSANEVGMWEKQKRWQQNAEKFKSKLEECESTLEKTRTLLQTARNNIARLEKDKQILEGKLNRVTSANAGGGNLSKCCRTPSCPNLRHHSGNKFAPSDSPETGTEVPSSTSSSPTHSASHRHSKSHQHPQHQHQHQHHQHSTVCCCHMSGAGCMHDVVQVSHQAELIAALKARIELQQRKILAMEMDDGKGGNALAIDCEKLQEKLSALEAHNIRLEAKNLQLTLDIDLMRQGDHTERFEKRIKHLEDYIIALKEELAQNEARRDICKCSSSKLSSHPAQNAERTILSLRNIVEKLRAENKYLKDGRRSSCESRVSSSTGTLSANDASNELHRVQQLYNEALEKMQTLQSQLKAKCATCAHRGKIETQIQDEMKCIREQLIKKTQLLQKAKVLLTRAAAKEKVLKEQLALWKRKCSELQNVPVIEEISE